MSSFIDQVFGSSASGSDGASLVTIIIATGQEPSIVVNQPIGKQKKICTYPGCEKNVTRKGRCYRHNIPIQCGFPGCTKQVKCIKYCYSHRDHKMCKFEGCTSRALIKGLCGEHGNYHRCKAEGCNKYIVCKGGFCRTHGKKNVCIIPGCDNYTKAYGYCVRHRNKQMCAISACNSIAVSKGVCNRHNALIVCKYEGCPGRVVKNYMCKQHLMGNQCTVEKCDRLTHNESGLCNQHTVNEYCSVDNCTNRPENGKRRCEEHSQANCIVMGCKKPIHMKRRCHIHYKLVICSTGGCTKKVYKDGSCIKHLTNICKIESCDNHQTHQEHKLCSEHFNKAKCIGEDCNKLAFHNYRCKLHLRTCMYPGCNVYASRVCDYHVKSLENEIIENY